MTNIQEHNRVEDAGLWARFQRDDMASYNHLIQKYSSPLFNFGYRFCQERNIVKDCIQELFLELWNKRSKISTPHSVKWYLFKALRNRILREQTKWVRNQDLDSHPGFLLEFSIEEKIIGDIQDLELASKVKNVLQQLPPRQREIIYLRFYENLDFEAIAQVMGLSRQSVHNLLQKAYNSIRQQWGVLVLLTLLCGKLQ
ncbi:MAG: sigma-70 family RNA polymerase sigma factor [Candidatus Pseudobacter hemicellulosilyticus]|uniref:Sigma-70 family RNA polymerase sigma factor n=1 Tax=Candidatus Pseudobacter hemicellulosilyticus TaxID=3121375 RepID=A0AAJ6BFA8_9BACT|nr:MAG: sigma-70 family RNA polymerase sigma factor [Pseudobacter sp.]